MIPFSALEIAIASRNKNLSRKEALAELKTSLGFSLDEIPECYIMKEYLKNECGSILFEHGTERVGSQISCETALLSHN